MDCDSRVTRWLSKHVERLRRVCVERAECGLVSRERGIASEVEGPQDCRRLALPPVAAAGMASKVHMAWSDRRSQQF